MPSTSTKIVRFIFGFLIMLFLGMFYAWSMFRQSLSEFFPTWTSSQASLNLSIFIITFCLGGLLAGRLTPKLGQKNVARIGAVVILIGGLLFPLMSRMNDHAALYMLYLSYGGVCGVGIGLVYNADISSIGSLFPAAGGIASGALLTGFGFGSMLFGWLITKIASAVGFFAALTGGIAACSIISFIGASFLIPLQAAKPAAETVITADPNDVTTGQMLRDPIFWLLFFWVVCITSGSLMIINSAAQIAVLFGVAAAIGMIVQVFNGLSRIGIGAIFDKLGSSRSLIAANACSLLSGLLLLLATMTGSAALMIAGAILAGAAYGCAMNLNAVVIREQFGSTHYAANLSVITMSGIVASLTGPVIAGKLQDASGGYTSTFVALLCFAGLAIVLLAVLLLIRKKKADKQTT